MKIFSIVATFSLALPGLAQTVPATINYQGRLTDNSPQQNPLTATANMSFELWDCAACVTPAPDRLWVEPASGTVPVAVTGGIFNVQLGGNGVPIPAALFSGGTQRWLQIIVNGEALAPRQQLTATGYANQAASATSAATAVTATTANNANNLGGVAAGGYQLATVQNCGAGQFVSAIGNGSASCGTPTSSVPNPLSLTQASAAVTLTAINTGAGPGLLGQSAAQNGVIGRSSSATDSGVYGENFGGGYGVAGLVNGYNPAVVGTNNGDGSAIGGFNYGNGRVAEFAGLNAASPSDALFVMTYGTGAVAHFYSGNYQSIPIKVDAYAEQTAKLQSWNVNGTEVASVSPAGLFAGAFAGSGAGLTDLNPDNLSPGTAAINITGSAGSVSNGVYTTGGYANPAWIVSLSGAKISGYVAQAANADNAINATYANLAGTVNNGVYTTGSYANPAWLTSLAGAKITGTVAQATNATTATTATSATNAAQLGGVAAAGYQLATTQSCGAGQFLSTIANGSASCSSPAANNLTAPVSISYGGPGSVMTLNNTGGAGLTSVSATGYGVHGQGSNPGSVGVFGVYGGGTISVMQNSGVSGFSGTGTGAAGISTTGTGVSGTATGTGTGVSGTSLGTGNAGLFQINNVASAAAAVSVNTNGTGDGINSYSAGHNGVAALSASSTDSGVYGANTGLGRAGFFQISSAASTAEGLLAATAGSGPGVAGTSVGGDGVQGFTTSATHSGVYGEGSAGSGVNFGVYGYTRSASGFGVFGGSTGGGEGVYGVSTNNIGVHGASNASNGVYGLSNLANGVAGNATGAGQAGVFGTNSNAASGYGVYGSVTIGQAVFGLATTSGWGVHGQSASGRGVFGESASDAGIYGSSTGTTGAAGDGVVGVTNSPAAAGVHARGSGTSGTALLVESGGIRVAGAGQNSATPAFTHVSSASTITGNRTLITHPLTDGDPNAILIVVPNYNPGGTGGVLDNHTIGVFYVGGKWAIFNQDIAAMPVGAAFNVLVIKP